MSYLLWLLVYCIAGIFRGYKCSWFISVVSRLLACSGDFCCTEFSHCLSCVVWRCGCAIYSHICLVIWLIVFFVLYVVWFCIHDIVSVSFVSNLTVFVLNFCCMSVIRSAWCYIIFVSASTYIIMEISYGYNYHVYIVCPRYFVIRGFFVT